MQRSTPGTAFRRASGISIPQSSHHSRLSPVACGRFCKASLTAEDMVYMAQVALRSAPSALMFDDSRKEAIRYSETETESERQPVRRNAIAVPPDDGD